MIRLSNLITEADDKQFSNPALNKKIKYKNSKGEDKENMVGNLLRLPKDNAGRIAAEKTLPKDGTPERKAINKSLGSEKDGKSVPSANNTKKGEDSKEKDSSNKSADEPTAQTKVQLFTADPAMSARLDKEKETQAKIAGDSKPKLNVPPPPKPKLNVPPAPKPKLNVPPAPKPKLNVPPAPKAKVPPPPPALPKTANSSDDGEAGLRKNVKTALTKPKVYVRAIRDGIKDWKEEEKAFFKEKVHKGDTPERRSWGKALKDKAVGAYHALKKGFKHEVHTFKDAATGIAMWKDGIDMTEPQKKAVKSVAKKFALGVLLGAVTGGVGAGAGAFAAKCVSGFIPHVIEETIIAGVGKAALFAGDTDIDEEKAMEQFLSVIADNIEKMDIPNEIIAKSVEEYNAEKKGDSITQNEARLAVNQLQQLVKESIIR
jgi:hypothetical protein